MTEPTGFSFSTVPNIICAAGASRQLGRQLRQQFGAVPRRVLLVTDAGFLGTGLAQPVIDSLQAEQFTVRIYSEVQADPPEAVVLQAVADARAADIELVIGLGGGSSMDVAKLIAVLTRSTQALTAIYGIGNVSGNRLPLVQIPTTAGTGSEVTPIAIVTTGAATKMGVVAPQPNADLAVLDAELTRGRPPKTTAATGIDAIVQAIEAYASKI